MTSPLQSNVRRYRVNGFGGGLNKAVSSFDINDNELRDAENVDLSLKGSIIPRDGIRTYIPTTSNNKQIKGMFRYSRSDGQREVVGNANGSLERSVGSGTAMTQLTTLSPSEDGFVRFSQWRNTCYAVSDTETGITYHKDATTEFRSIGLNNLFTFQGNGFILSDSKTVGAANTDLQAVSKYTYRYTFDYKHGNDFVGESDPVFFTNLSGGGSYDNSSFITGSAPVDISLILTKGSEPLASDISAINFYRTPALDTSAKTGRQERNTGFYWVGSVSATDYNNAVLNDILLEDAGLPLGRQIRYGVSGNIPKSRFACAHKNRMWYGRTPDDTNAIYFSEYLEPEAVRATSIIPVGIGNSDDDGITGMLSWKNRQLLVFKPNSVWQVLGADIELSTGVPDLILENISEMEGCIAPGTIATGEGVIFFLTNKGLYFYDGTRPKPLNFEKVKPLFDAIPASRKYFATGVYSNKNRQYILCFSSNDDRPDRNTICLVYDFFTNTWSKRKYFSSNVGYNDLIELRRGDEAIGVIGSDVIEGGAPQSAAGAIHLFDDVSYELSTTQGVIWNASTKFFDFGAPEIVKEFKAVVVSCKATKAFTVEWNVDDGQATDTYAISPTGDHTWDEAALNWQGAPIETITHVWDGVRQGDKYKRLPQKDSNDNSVRGKRIGLTFKSDTGTDIKGIEIHGATFLWKPERRPTREEES